MEFPGGWELVLVLAIGVVLFGSKRLPDAARSLGRSMRILKSEVKGLRDDDTDSHDEHLSRPVPPRAADERDETR